MRWEQKKEERAVTPKAICHLPISDWGPEVLTLFLQVTNNGFTDDLCHGDTIEIVNCDKYGQSCRVPADIHWILKPCWTFLHSWVQKKNPIFFFFAYLHLEVGLWWTFPRCSSSCCVGTRGARFPQTHRCTGMAGGWKSEWTCHWRWRWAGLNSSWSGKRKGKIRTEYPQGCVSGRRFLLGHSFPLEISLFSKSGLKLLWLSRKLKAREMRVSKNCWRV